MTIIDDAETTKRLIMPRSHASRVPCGYCKLIYVHLNRRSSVHLVAIIHERTSLQRRFRSKLGVLTTAAGSMWRSGTTTICLRYAQQSVLQVAMYTTTHVCTAVCACSSFMMGESLRLKYRSLLRRVRKHWPRQKGSAIKRPSVAHSSSPSGTVASWGVER